MLGMMMCREATRLMSKRLDAPLSRRETISLTLHLGMCGACKRCNRQFRLLHRVGDAYETAPRDASTPDGDSNNDDTRR